MKEQSEKVVIDGNAFYELDLDCQKKMENQTKVLRQRNEERKKRTAEENRKRRRNG
ncbi:MAG: hypothetical protein ACI4EG_12730 [Fusicatenibacter sp.]